MSQRARLKLASVADAPKQAPNLQGASTADTAVQSAAPTQRGPLNVRRLTTILIVVAVGVLSVYLLARRSR